MTDTQKDRMALRAHVEEAMRRAHSSGLLDGVEVELLEYVELHWEAEVLVWRREYSHPFRFAARSYDRELAWMKAQLEALNQAFIPLGLPGVITTADQDEEPAEKVELSSDREDLDKPIPHLSQAEHGCDLMNPSSMGARNVKQEHPKKEPSKGPQHTKKHVNISRCRSCDAEIIWVKTESGKSTPQDPDGESHFATCPQGKDWKGKTRKSPNQPRNAGLFPKAKLAIDQAKKARLDRDDPERLEAPRVGVGFVLEKGHFAVRRDGYGKLADEDHMWQRRAIAMAKKQKEEGSPVAGLDRSLVEFAYSQTLARLKKRYIDRQPSEIERFEYRVPVEPMAIDKANIDELEEWIERIDVGRRRSIANKRADSCPQCGRQPLNTFQNKCVHCKKCVLCGKYDNKSHMSGSCSTVDAKAKGQNPPPPPPPAPIDIIQAELAPYGSDRDQLLRLKSLMDSAGLSWGFGRIRKISSALSKLEQGEIVVLNDHIEQFSDHESRGGEG